MLQDLTTWATLSGDAIINERKRIARMRRLFSVVIFALVCFGVLTSILGQPLSFLLPSPLINPIWTLGVVLVLFGTALAVNRKDETYADLASDYRDLSSDEVLVALDVFATAPEFRDHLRSVAAWGRPLTYGELRAAQAFLAERQEKARWCNLWNLAYGTMSGPPVA